MKEFEWFEWFGPSPIEPFNPGGFWLRNRRALGAAGDAMFRSVASSMLFSLVVSGSSPGIDNVAHVGGAVSGLLLGAALALVERFDRRGTEPFELFRSEFGQDSGIFVRIHQKLKNNPGC